MGEETIAANLIRLRKNKGITQEQLAEAAGLSRAGYRKIEKARVKPQADSLRSLAKALKVPVRELVVAAPTLKKVRFRALKRLRRREQVLYEVGRRLSNLNSLEELLGDHEENMLPALRKKIKQEAANDIKKAAELVREEFKLQPKAPIHDICGLLESRGIKIWSVKVESKEFFGLSVGEEDGGPAIVVNTWNRLPVELWIFSAAHELAHLLFHLDDYDVAEELEAAVQEKEKAANEFASHFLMPEDAFRSEWEDTEGISFLDRVLKVKRIFRVSWRTVVYRVAEHYSEEKKALIWKRFATEFKRRYKRAIAKHDEPDPLTIFSYRDHPEGEPAAMESIDFQGDRLYRLVRQAIEGGIITLGRGAEILSLSLDEMRELADSWLP